MVGVVRKNEMAPDWFGRICFLQVKWSVTLTDRLGPEILTGLEIKGQVLHRVRLHVKVPGWLLNLNALLTKKMPFCRV